MSLNLCTLMMGDPPKMCCTISAINPFIYYSLTHTTVYLIPDYSPFHSLFFCKPASLYILGMGRKEVSTSCLQLHQQ